MNIFNLLLKLGNLIVITIILCTAIMLWYQQRYQMFSPTVSKVKEVKVAMVKRAKIKQEVVASGKISSKKIRMIRSKTGGIVKLLSCKEGDVVKEGEILCIIKDPTIFGESKKIEKALFNKNFTILENYLRRTYNKKLEALISAEINYHSALKRYNQVKLLYEKGAVSNQEFIESEIEYQKAEFQYYRNRASVKEELSLPRIIAPYNGTIISTRVTEGTEVEAGSELFLLADMASPIAKIVVDECEIEKVKVGQKVKITGESFAPYILNGTVEKIADYAYQSERGFPGIEVDCNIKLDKEIDRLLKLDTSCIGKIIIEEKENVLCIPSIALLADKEGTKVFVVNNSQVHLRKIITGIISEDLAEVNDGLKEGEKVVTMGSLELQDSDYVRIKK